MLAVACVLLAAGCTSSPPDAERSEDALGDPPASIDAPATTTTLPPRPPEIRVTDRARAEIGQVFSDAIVVIDPNGDGVTVDVSGRTPEGFSLLTSPRGLVTGFQWRPVDAGEWTIEVTAVDDGGLEASRSFTLVSRYPRDRDLLLAMGDSVAAGFGRDRSDFAGSDTCFRSERDAYGVQVADSLIEAGAFVADAETVVVACAGATAASLREVLVDATDDEGEAVGVPKSQLDAAVEANPTIVTLTIGSTDVSLFDAQALTEPGANGDPAAARDSFLIDRRIESFEQGLRLALDRLVRSTDAHIVVTTWYDPTAAAPIGVEGCTGDCFSAVMASTVASVNEVIRDVAAAQPPGRVSVAGLDGDADRFEASNGFGPDALRDLGPLQDLVGTFTGGSSATCAATGEPEVELLSTLDCAHPTTEGHNEIARIVTEVLLAI